MRKVAGLIVLSFTVALSGCLAATSKPNPPETQHSKSEPGETALPSVTKFQHSPPTAFLNKKELEVVAAQGWSPIDSSWNKEPISRVRWDRGHDNVIVLKSPSPPTSVYGMAYDSVNNKGIPNSAPTWEGWCSQPMGGKKQDFVCQLEDKGDSSITLRPSIAKKYVIIQASWLIAPTNPLDPTIEASTSWAIPPKS